MSTTGLVTGTPLSAVEVELDYGGDYILTSTGDLATIQDSAYSPIATIQRVTFLILTNPAMPNVTGTAVGEPDDLFNPDYGSGARAFVGRSSDIPDFDAIERNIQNALALDPYILQNPRPTVSFTNDDDGTVTVTVSFTTKTGQLVTIPDLALGGPAVS